MSRALFLVAALISAGLVQAVSLPPSGALIVGTASANCASPGYPTISAAVNAAAAGSTIYVCAGVYPESVLITKNLTLLGAQYGVAATIGRTDSTQESVVMAPGGSDINYSGVGLSGTLDGFELIGNGLAAGDNDGIIAVEGSPAGFTWRNNIIENTTTGINFHADGTVPTDISGNRIDHNNELGGSQGSNGVFFTNGPANNVSIHGNAFGYEDTDINTTGSGGTVQSTNLSVENNSSIDTTNFVVLFLTDHATFNGNNISWLNVNDTAAGTAIYVSGGNTNTTISNNTITGGESTGVGLNLNFYTTLPSTNISVLNNTISQRLNGVRVSSGAMLDATTLIKGNTVTAAGVGDPPGGGNGVWIQTNGGIGIQIQNNFATGSTVDDCRDDTTGSGTLSTASVWAGNIGNSASPAGLCSNAPSVPQPSEPVPMDTRWLLLILIGMLTTVTALVKSTRPDSDRT